MSLALLADSYLPKTFWDEACLTSCYLINRLPTPLLKFFSPFEKFFSHSPDYKFLKNFECACFPKLKPYNSHKFSLRSKQCVFLGYSSHHKGYECYHLESGRMYISRNVVFHEIVFPFFTKTLPFVSFAPHPTPYSSFSLPIASPNLSGSTPPILPSLPDTSIISHSPSTSPSPRAICLSHPTSGLGSSYTTFYANKISK